MLLFRITYLNRLSNRIGIHVLIITYRLNNALFLRFKAAVGNTLESLRSWHPCHNIDHGIR